MSTAASAKSPQIGAGSAPDRAMWLLFVAAFFVMYVPVYWNAARSTWQSEEHGHGAIVLAVVIWLFWSKRDALQGLDANKANPVGGWIAFAMGLLLYVVGQIVDITIFKFGSQIPLIVGVLLLSRGWPALRLLWFPIIYIVFMIPLPGVLVDAITGQLKQWVSVIAENILHTAGYPIGRTGVMLTIGQYQLLVADACSGLNSMFSLSALGLLFIYIMNRRNVVYISLMILSILPIAFVANIVRVIALVLITYYLGDEAAQGFLHGAAGMVLMIVALIIFFALDWVLAALLLPKPTSRAA